MSRSQPGYEAIVNRLAEILEEKGSDVLENAWIIPLIPDASSTGLIERVLARYGGRGG